MGSRSFDAVVIGAGSVGVPIALSLAQNKIKTLVVEKLASSGQGENKKALGGIRATHSNASKIKVCLRSLEVFKNWENQYGDDIEWKKGGYIFPSWSLKTEEILKSLIPMQKSTGMPIDYISAAETKKVVPGIREKNLRGATYSPDDGSASPMLAINAFYKKAKEHGAEFMFRAGVDQILVEKGRIAGVIVNGQRIEAPIVINAAGANAGEICAPIGSELRVEPDSHEAAITEPVGRVLDPMIVDIEARKDSKNAYFYQNPLGQLIGCYTPDPAILGKDIDETSAFLPVLANRMIFMIPKLKNVRIRRVWRGLYPNTPDGLPFIGESNVPGLLHAAGMCGHGFMMGPGVGELVARIVKNTTTSEDVEILKDFDPNREVKSAKAGDLK